MECCIAPLLSVYVVTILYTRQLDRNSNLACMEMYTDCLIIVRSMCIRPYVCVSSSFLNATRCVCTTVSSFWMKQNCGGITKGSHNQQHWCNMGMTFLLLGRLFIYGDVVTPLRTHHSPIFPVKRFFLFKMVRHIDCPNGN